MSTQRLALTTECYRKPISSGEFDLFRFMELASKEFELTAVELEHRDFQSADPAYLQSLKSKAAECQLEILNVGLFNDYGKPTKEEREQEFERFKAWLPVPKILGASFYRIFGAHTSDPERWDDATDYVKRSCILAREEGVSLLLEPEGYGFPNDAETTLELFREVDQDNLGLLLDTGNYTDGFPSIERTLHLAPHVHAKFLRVDQDGNEVDIDYDAIFDLLNERGYKGYVTCEYEGEEDAFTAVPRVIARLKRYLAEG